MTRRGSGWEYTDLERLRVEYWIARTDLTVREMATRLGRSRASLFGWMYKQGIWISEERGGGGRWSGV